MPDAPVTVHIIANAHLDPVWLWPWQAGLDEVLATCRTMCNLLDHNPDAIFTAGEAWRYRQIELTDTVLFERIRKHVREGRWALVGGWWIQPDCNFPSSFAMRKQIECGKRYFLDRFGLFPETGYNVDSFGHASTLPSIMHEAGQRFYIMMRPDRGEMTLPARLFRWREKPGAPSILTFRLDGYGTWTETPAEGDVRNAISGLPDGIRHTMCFVGVGDHGGGLTQRMVEWVREHKTSIDGCRLEFSTPQRFFSAVAGQAEDVPEVVGELQYHAVGCYSVMRGIKNRVRRAEHLLDQAEMVARTEDREELDRAWEHLAFNHFHDILGGTSIPSAYEQQYDQLGAAASVADRILQHHLRKSMCQIPDNPLQRIAVYNASREPFEGYVEHEPWLRKGGWTADRRLLDENGQELPYQAIATEHVNQTGEGWRFLWKTRIEAGGMRVFRLDMQMRADISPALRIHHDSIITEGGAGVDLGPTPALLSGHSPVCPLPRLDIIEDRTDNWSHSVDRYPDGPVQSPDWSKPYLLDSGPIKGSLSQDGEWGRSTFRAEWRVYGGEPWVDLILDIHWAGKDHLCKLTLPLDGKVAERVEGVPGGELVRPNTGRECPLHDWTFLALDKGNLGIASPDIYAIDVTTQRLRLTLLRSPILTQYNLFPVNRTRAIHSDQGAHHFRIRFCIGSRITAEYIARQAMQMHRPPLAADLTRGMPRV